MDSLKKLCETVDSKLNSVREQFHDILTGMVFKENQLNSLQESVMERSKEVDMIRESIEEGLKEIEKKEVELKELVLIRKDGLKDLELRKKEIEVRREKLTEQEKFTQQVSERMELEFELKEKIFSSREAELFAKEKELEEREKVLASRNDQIVFREKQLELRNMILNLKTPERNPLLLEYEDLIKRRDTIMPVTETIVPPEGSLPMRNTNENQVEKKVSKEKEFEANEGDQLGLGPKEKEVETTKGKEKSLPLVVAQKEAGGLREKVLPSIRSDLTIPKEEQLDGTVGLADYGEGNFGKSNAATAHIEESRNSTQNIKKRGRPPTNQVELKTEEIDGNIDSVDGVKGKPGFPNVDAVDAKGQTMHSRTKRARVCKNNWW